MKKTFLSVILLLTVMTNLQANPFFKAYKTPHETTPFDKIKNEHYEPAFEKGMKEHKAEIDALKAEKAAKEAQDDNYSSIYDNVENIADYTAKMANSKEYSEEVLEYMRDLAEQEAINRYTTSDINVDMSGMQNIVNNDMDLDGVVDYLGEGVYEAMEIAAEGGV